MTLRLPTRALAPVIALAVLGGIVATFMVYRTMPSGAESGGLTVTPKLKKAPVKPAKPAVKPKAKAKPARPKAKTQPVTPPVAVPPVVKPVEAPKGDPVDANGLPLILAKTLAKHPVTVVVLYDPGASIDELALAEARAGATEVKAGFLPLSIRNERQVRPLAQLHGVLETPAILVYERPNTLFLRLEGFSDRETVAQAAANAQR